MILYYVGGKPIHPGKAIDDPESGSLRPRLGLSSLPLAVLVAHDENFSCLFVLADDQGEAVSFGVRKRERPAANAQLGGEFSGLAV